METLREAGARDDAERSASSVEKALQVLDAIAEAGHSVGVSEVARRSGLPKSTAFRLLAVLESAGMLRRRGSKYEMGFRLLELGNGARRVSAQRLHDIAMPELVELHVQTKQIVHLGVLVDTDVLYLEKIFGRNNPRSPSAVGARLPATCCGLGKALLAFSDEGTIRAALERLPNERRTPYTFTQPRLFLDELMSIRKSGVAFDREESAIGLTCIATPVLGADGRPVGAVSLSGRTSAFDPAARVSSIRRTAQRISELLRAETH